MRLSSEPKAAKILAPGVKGPLTSPVGDALRGLLQVESAITRIDGVSTWMQDHLDVPVEVEDLALLNARRSSGQDAVVSGR